MKGQLYCRGPYAGPNGKRVWILAGIVEDGDLVNGMQYTISLPPILTNGIDQEKQTRGMTIDQVLREPIWRI